MKLELIPNRVKNEIETVDFIKSYQVSNTDTMDSIPFGSSKIRYGSAGAALGVIGVVGTVNKYPAYNSGAFAIFSGFTTSGSASKLLYNTQLEAGGSWFGWQELVNHETLNQRVSSDLSIRRDNSVGTRIFAGNTMIYGDTGPKILHSNNTPPLYGTGDIYIRRMGDQVHLQISQYRPDTTSGGKTIFSIPTGFRPHRNLFSIPIVDRDSDTTYYLDVLANGSVVEVGTLPEGRLYLEISWTTNTSWPITSLA